MVSISMAGMRKEWLKIWHIMSTVKVFAMQDGRMDSQPDG